MSFLSHLVQKLWSSLERILVILVPKGWRHICSKVCIFWKCLWPFRGLDSAKNLREHGGGQGYLIIFSMFFRNGKHYIESKMGSTIPNSGWSNFYGDSKTLNWTKRRKMTLAMKSRNAISLTNSGNSFEIWHLGRSK